MIDSRLEHINNEYYIKASNNKERNICVVTMPENIFLEYPEITSIYELEEGKITVYRNKEKFLTKECPNYARRTAVWSHLVKIMESRDLLEVPVLIENDNKLIDCGTIESAVTKLLIEPQTNEDFELEIKLINTIGEISKLKTKDIPKNVLDGFNVCMSIFKGD